MDTVIVIMLKNKETGFLEKELQTLSIEKNEDYILNVFATEEEEGLKLHLRLTTERDLKDWEYTAVYDYYDEEVFAPFEVEILDSEYNPVWEVCIPMSESREENEKSINELLEKHKKELDGVYNVIADKENEYEE